MSKTANYITIEEFSERASLSTSTVRRRVKLGQIPSWQPGGRGTRILIPSELLTAKSTVNARGEPEIPSTKTDQHVKQISGAIPRWKNRLRRKGL
jgi:excisionase family DNA binding protein